MNLRVAISAFVVEILWFSKSCQRSSDRYDADSMPEFAVLLIHLITTIVGQMGPGGARLGIAESLLVKHQLLVLNRERSLGPQH